MGLEGGREIIIGVNSHDGVAVYPMPWKSAGEVHDGVGQTARAWDQSC